MTADMEVTDAADPWDGAVQMMEEACIPKPAYEFTATMEFPNLHPVASERYSPLRVTMVAPVDGPAVGLAEKIWNPAQTK
jgi:hypothetical protein